MLNRYGKTKIQKISVRILVKPFYLNRFTFSHTVSQNFGFTEMV